MLLTYSVGFCLVMLPFPVAQNTDGVPKPQIAFRVSPGLADVAFSQNGKWLATAGGQLEKFGEVKLWDLASGKEVHGFARQKDLVLSVAFAPDGQTLASGGWDQMVQLWDVATGEQRATLRGHTRQVWSVAFSPDGQLLASGSADQTTRLWDVATGREKASLPGAGGAVVVFSPEGRTLAVGSDEGPVNLWEVATGRQKAVLQGHTNRVAAAAFAPDGMTLATASWDATLKLWEMPRGRLKSTLNSHQGSLVYLTYNPDGKMLISACRYHRAFQHGGPIGGIARVEDGSEVKLWEVATERERITFEPVPAQFQHHKLVAVRVTANGKSLITVHNDGTVRLWDLARLAARPKRCPTGTWNHPATRF